MSAPITACRECAYYLEVPLRDRLLAPIYNCKAYKCAVAPGGRPCGKAKARKRGGGAEQPTLL